MRTVLFNNLSRNIFQCSDLHVAEGALFRVEHVCLNTLLACLMLAGDKLSVDFHEAADLAERLVIKLLLVYTNSSKDLRCPLL